MAVYKINENKKKVSEAITKDNFRVQSVGFDIITPNEDIKIGPDSSFVRKLSSALDEVGYELVDPYGFEIEDVTEYYNEDDLFFEEPVKEKVSESLKESFSKFGSPTDLQTFIDQFDPTGQGSKSAYLKTVSAMIKKYNCTRDEAKAVLADWFSWEDPDLLKESLDSDIHELENFMGLHYYGLPDVKLQDVPSEELKKMRDIARRALDSSSRSYGRYSNDKDSYYMRRYRKYLDLLNDALKIARDKEAGVYDIKRQIEKDLWSIVVPLYGTDWTYRTLDPDKLKELRQKYKDDSSLFNRLVKDVRRSLNSTD